jgi:hypothetical protein
MVRTDPLFASVEQTLSDTWKALPPEYKKKHRASYLQWIKTDRDEYAAALMRDKGLSFNEAYTAETAEANNRLRAALPRSIQRKVRHIDMDELFGRMAKAAGAPKKKPSQTAKPPATPTEEGGRPEWGWFRPGYYDGYTFNKDNMGDDGEANFTWKAQGTDKVIITYTGKDKFNTGTSLLRKKGEKETVYAVKDLGFDNVFPPVKSVKINGELRTPTIIFLTDEEINNGSTKGSASSGTFKPGSYDLCADGKPCKERDLGGIDFHPNNHTGLYSFGGNGLPSLESFSWKKQGDTIVITYIDGAQIIAHVISDGIIELDDDEVVRGGYYKWRNDGDWRE